MKKIRKFTKEDKVVIRELDWLLNMHLLQARMTIQITNTSCSAETVTLFDTSGSKKKSKRTGKNTRSGRTVVYKKVKKKGKKKRKEPVRTGGCA